MKAFPSIKELSDYDERRLDPKEVEDVIEIYNKLPYIQIARNYFVSMILRCPPEVKFKTLKLDNPKELELILEIKYLPWLISMYNWLKMFGVFPWYFESLSGDSIHKFPVVPPMDAGYITTYVDKKHRQQFRWYWNREPDSERKMYFIFDEGHLPALTGKLRSSIASLIHEYRSAKIARETSEMSWYQQAHPQHIFEFHPPRNVPADDNLMNLESFGEKIAGTVLAQQEGIKNTKFTIQKDYLQDSLSRTYYKNKGLKKRFGGPFMKSDTEKQQWELENASIVEKGIPLNADFSYKHVPAPNVNANFVQIMNRLDMLSSSVMDIPLNNIESGGSKTIISVESSLRFVNERIKGWISTFIRATKKALLLAYGDQILEAFGDRYRKSYTGHNMLDKKAMEVYTDEEIEVLMPCSPIANKQDYYMLWRSGMMDQETAARYLFNDIGIPPEDITISTPMMDQEKPKKQKMGF
jgi:hypothetical protein